MATAARPFLASTRLRLLAACALMLLLMLVRVPGASGVAGGAAATNVILLMADDQGWGDVGYNPHLMRDPTQPAWRRNSPRSPNLDALAASEHSIVWWRFHAGSALCSPTRSAAMTGRTPMRECISGPEPHGYGPAWSCFSPLPLSPRTFTIAEAAQQVQMDTFHAGAHFRTHSGTASRHPRHALLAADPPTYFSQTAAGHMVLTR